MAAQNEIAIECLCSEDSKMEFLSFPKYRNGLRFVRCYKCNFEMPESSFSVSAEGELELIEPIPPAGGLKCGCGRYLQPKPVTHYKSGYTKMSMIAATGEVTSTYRSKCTSYTTKEGDEVVGCGVVTSVPARSMHEAVPIGAPAFNNKQAKQYAIAIRKKQVVIHPSVKAEFSHHF